MKTERVYVLDLGSSKIAGLVAERDLDGSFQPIAVATEPCRGIRKGCVVDLDETSQAVDRVCRTLSQSIGGEVGALTIALGGPHVEGVTAQGFVPIYPRSRPISTDDVMQVINHSRQIMCPPDREQVQVLPREFRIDGQRGIRRPIGMNGSKLEVLSYLVTGQSTHIQNADKALQMVGRKLDQMVLMPLAAAISVLSDEQRDLGSVLVDLGAGKTDVAVFSAGAICYSSCVPVGGQHVTSDISKLLKTSPEEAERLKLQYGSAVAKGISGDETVEVLQLGQTHTRALQRRILCEITESRIRELAQMIRQQIEKSGLYGMLPGGIVLTGGGSLLQNVKGAFEAVLPHHRIELGRPSVEGQRGMKLNRPELSVLVGLAKYALDPGNDDFAPVQSGNGSLMGRVKNMWSQISGK